MASTAARVSSHDERACTCAQARTDILMHAARLSGPAAVLRQVEYYFSDENLCRDSFLNSQMASDPLGEKWVTCEVCMLTPPADDLGIYHIIPHPKTHILITLGAPELSEAA